MKSLISNIINTKKNTLVLIGILFFVIQGFLFVFYYGDNWYIEVGSLALPIDQSYLNSGIFPYDELFKITNTHIHFFPRVVLLFSLFFDDYDTKNIMYFGLIILSGSLFLLYKILNRIDKNLVWLLIPFSALLFNPIQYTVLLWAFGSMDWFLPIFGLLGIVYYLNKPKIDSKSFIIALFFGIVSSFSLVLGTIVFLSGIFSLISRKEWVKSSIWIASLILVFFIYYSFIEQSEELVFNEPLPINFLKFLSIPFVVKYDILYYIIGTFILISFFTSMFFHKIKIQKYTLIPFIQLAFVSIISGLLISFGKSALSYYYAVFSNLITISVIMLITLIIISLKTRKQKKTKLVIIFLITIIISQSFLLLPSYYMGWKLGQEFSIEETMINSCFSININNSKLCDERFDFFENTEFLQIMNGMQKKKIGPFMDGGTVDNNNKFEKKLYDEKFSNAITSNGIGQIEYVNQQTIQENDTIFITGPLLTISGWILDENGKQVDSVYILSNNEIISKISNFEKRSDIKTQTQINSKLTFGWSTNIITNYLKNDCNEIEIVGIKDNKKILVNDEIIICKYSSNIKN